MNPTTLNKEEEPIVKDTDAGDGVYIQNTDMKATGNHLTTFPELIVIVIENSTVPTKAKSWEPACSQALVQNKIDRQQVRSRESGR